MKNIGGLNQFKPEEISLYSQILTVMQPLTKNIYIKNKTNTWLLMLLSKPDWLELKKNAWMDGEEKGEITWQ